VRQSLAMSGGDWGIFAHRPIATSMLGVGVALLAWNVWSALRRHADWRTRVGLDDDTSTGIGN